jgi:hypothetical protein
MRFSRVASAAAYSRKPSGIPSCQESLPLQPPAQVGRPADQGAVCFGARIGPGCARVVPTATASRPGRHCRPAGPADHARAIPIIVPAGRESIPIWSENEEKCGWTVLGRKSSFYGTLGAVLPRVVGVGRCTLTLGMTICPFQISNWSTVPRATFSLLRRITSIWSALTSFSLSASGP